MRSRAPPAGSGAKRAPPSPGTARSRGVNDLDVRGAQRVAATRRPRSTRTAITTSCRQQCDAGHIRPACPAQRQRGPVHHPAARLDLHDGSRSWGASSPRRSDEGGEHIAATREGPATAERTGRHHCDEAFTGGSSGPARVAGGLGSRTCPRSRGLPDSSSRRWRRFAHLRSDFFAAIVLADAHLAAGELEQA
jgi:hypothetical protein